MYALFVGSSGTAWLDNERLQTAAAVPTRCWRTQHQRSSQAYLQRATGRTARPAARLVASSRRRRAAAALPPGRPAQPAPVRCVRKCLMAPRAAPPTRLRTRCCQKSRRQHVAVSTAVHVRRRRHVGNCARGAAAANTATAAVLGSGLQRAGTSLSLCALSYIARRHRGQGVAVPRPGWRAQPSPTCAFAAAEPATAALL